MRVGSTWRLCWPACRISFLEAAFSAFSPGPTRPIASRRAQKPGQRLAAFFQMTGVTRRQPFCQARLQPNLEVLDPNPTSACPAGQPSEFGARDLPRRASAETFVPDITRVRCWINLIAAWNATVEGGAMGRGGVFVNRGPGAGARPELCPCQRHQESRLSWGRLPGASQMRGPRVALLGVRV